MSWPVRERRMSSALLALVDRFEQLRGPHRWSWQGVSREPSWLLWVRTLSSNCVQFLGQ